MGTAEQAEVTKQVGTALENEVVNTVADAEASIAFIDWMCQPDIQAELATTLGTSPTVAKEHMELTEAERQVALLVAKGLTNSDIAARLHLSTRTVEAHLSHAYVKLGVRSRVALVAKVLG